MARKPSSSARGYGWKHHRQRQAMPPPNGEPCPYCGHPMWPDQQLDADHATARVLGGAGELRWAHASCNRSAGARLGNALRGRLSRTWSDRWG